MTECLLSVHIALDTEASALRKAEFLLSESLQWSGQLKTISEFTTKWEAPERRHAQGDPRGTEKGPEGVRRCFPQQLILELKIHNN